MITCTHVNDDWCIRNHIFIYWTSDKKSTWTQWASANYSIYTITHNIGNDKKVDPGDNLTMCRVTFVCFILPRASTSCELIGLGPVHDDTLPLPFRYRKLFSLSLSLSFSLSLWNSVYLDKKLSVISFSSSCWRPAYLV